MNSETMFNKYATITRGGDAVAGVSFHDRNDLTGLLEEYGFRPGTYKVRILVKDKSPSPVAPASMEWFEPYSIDQDADAVV
jgi:hypothetical protein